MRPRNKKHLEERFNKCINLVAEDPLSLKGKWRSLFEYPDKAAAGTESDTKADTEAGTEAGAEAGTKAGTQSVCPNKELRLEIGCGKGAFITGMAIAHPDVNFIAMECVKNVLVTALEKTAAANLKNIRFVLINANILTDLFDPGEIDMIYLNFSDPWPRKKQAKHRLTHAAFLKSYGTVLSEKGHIIQKTDNDGLFAYSIESFNENGWRLENVSYDLHGPDTPEYILKDNIITEYERRFMENGTHIKRLEAYPPRP